MHGPIKVKEYPVFASYLYEGN